MEIVVKAFLFYNINKIDEFYIRVNEENHIRVVRKLCGVHEDMVNCLKQLKEDKLIKSIYIPKNKTIKEQLQKIVYAKKRNKKINQKN